MKASQKGFSLVELVIILTVIGLLTLVGVRIHNSKKTNSPDATSKTSVPTKKIVAVGDVACSLDDPNLSGTDSNYCQSAETHALVANIKPDAVLALGDLQYDKGEINNFLGSYDKDWGKEKDITYPAPGNHEYETPSAAGYFKYFNNTDSTGRAGETGKGYYSFLLGAWHIIALNSNCEHIGGCSKDSAQLKWLEQELSTSPKTCTLAFWHHPHFSSGKYYDDSGSKKLSADFWNVLIANRADVVLNGHDHLYERFAPQTADGVAKNDGIRQFTVGTGGKVLYQEKGAEANSEKLVDSNFGILELELSDQSYTWHFISVDGETQDSGRQTCSI